ncbi:MAG: elongation factor Tu [Synechococcaceae cyanobacterium]|nr:elongation factor Tu [Synechococcaceae cyanobacterium]
MAREKIAKTKPNVNVGTIGQGEHGKTTLTAAITVVLSMLNETLPKPYEDIDGAPEERTRGININIAHVEYETDTRHYAHVDCPEHMDYIKNMITGAAQMNSAILVVDASEGPTTQTKEQLLLAKITGVQAMVVFLSKQDLIPDEDSIRAVEADVRQLLNQCGYSGNDTPVISGSALEALDYIRWNQSATHGENVWVDSIHDLLRALDTHIPLPRPDSDKPFLQGVEDVGLSADGRPLAKGRIEYGKVQVGDPVEIVGNTRSRETKVVGMEMFGRPYAQGLVGDNLGLLLEGIAAADLARGMVVAAPNTIKPHIRFECETYVLTKDEGGRHTPFFTGYRPQFSFRTTDVTGMVTALRSKDGDSVEMVMPGERITMGVELIIPVALELGQRFAIREAGRTIGCGVITKVG